MISILLRRHLSLSAPIYARITKVPLPALSPTMDSGSIVGWDTKEGDRLSKSDLMAEIETDKATMAFETLKDGYFAKIPVPAGTKDVPLGKPMCVIVENKDDLVKFKNFSAEQAKAIIRRKKAAATHAALASQAIVANPTSTPSPSPPATFTDKPPIWEVVPVEAKVGAILPFSQLNFLQIIVFPYTYAVMYYLDFLLNFLPWWQAIIATTATARLMFFPLVLKQNIIGIKSFNILPQTQKLQTKLNEAMVSGDAYNQALTKTKLQILYKEHGISMKERLLPILIQAPMYASIFFLLRSLTAVPVEGLATGGALWFTDLTMPDPYYVLPIMTCSSMYLLFEYGLEGAVSPSQGMAPIGRYILRGMPLVLFIFIQSFPAATLLFWATSNSFTLFYALMMKTKWVKRKFNIPARLVHDPADLPLANMSFKGQVKSAIDKGKIKRTSLDVRRLDDIAFKKAGIGPLRKTYKEPPKDS